MHLVRGHLWLHIPGQNETKAELLLFFFSLQVGTELLQRLPFWTWPFVQVRFGGAQGVDRKKKITVEEVAAERAVNV